MGNVFEEICKQYLWKLILTEQSEVNVADLGRWWGTNPKTRKQVEIDIMGTEDKSKALFAECKWTNENVDLSVLELLMEKTALFHYKDITLYLFAKSGFTAACMKRAAELGNVKLVKYEDMLANN